MHGFCFLHCEPLVSPYFIQGLVSFNQVQSYNMQILQIVLA